eukprot:1147806-Pelagomonas_calceolata.AAC.2
MTILFNIERRAYILFGSMPSLQAAQVHASSPSVWPLAALINYGFVPVQASGFRRVTPCVLDATHDNLSAVAAWGAQVTPSSACISCN